MKESIYSPGIWGAVPLVMLSAIMTKPDFAEVMFLVAFIIFVIELVVMWTKTAAIPSGFLTVAGLACVALGLLAL